MNLRVTSKRLQKIMQQNGKHVIEKILMQVRFNDFS